MCALQMIFIVLHYVFRPVRQCVCAYPGRGILRPTGKPSSSSLVSGSVPLAEIMLTFISFWAQIKITGLVLSCKATKPLHILSVLPSVTGFYFVPAKRCQLPSVSVCLHVCLFARTYQSDTNYYKFINFLAFWAYCVWPWQLGPPAAALR